MATLVGSTTAVNMADVTRLQALLLSFATGTSTATQFTTTNPSDGGTWVFDGNSFGGFSGGIPTTGNLTGITLSKSGVQLAVITGLSMTIGDFFSALATNDPVIVGAFMFRDNDTITGSTQGDSLFGF